MFVEVNGMNINMYSIATFKPVDKKVENSSGEPKYTDVYLIIYVANGGTVIEEKFSSSSERDSKLNTLKTKFVTVSDTTE